MMNQNTQLATLITVSIAVCVLFVLAHFYGVPRYLEFSLSVVMLLNGATLCLTPILMSSLGLKHEQSRKMAFLRKMATLQLWGFLFVLIGGAMIITSVYSLSSLFQGV